MLLPMDVGQSVEALEEGLGSHDALPLELKGLESESDVLERPKLLPAAGAAAKGGEGGGYDDEDAHGEGEEEEGVNGEDEGIAGAAAAAASKGLGALHLAEESELHSLEQALLLGMAVQKRKGEADDEIKPREATAFADGVLQQRSSQVNAPPHTPCLVLCFL